MPVSPRGVWFSSGETADRHCITCSRFVRGADTASLAFARFGSRGLVSLCLCFTYRRPLTLLMWAKRFSTAPIGFETFSASAGLRERSRLRARVSESYNARKPRPGIIGLRLVAEARSFIAACAGFGASWTEQEQQRSARRGDLNGAAKGRGVDIGDRESTSSGSGPGSQRDQDQDGGLEFQRR